MTARETTEGGRAMIHAGGTGVSTAYKISKGADRYRRRWQAEAAGAPLRFARRAYTPEGAVRLMARDLAFYERTGRHTLHQRRRTWWALNACRAGVHHWRDKLGHSDVGQFCPRCGSERGAVQ